MAAVPQGNRFGNGPREARFPGKEWSMSFIGAAAVVAVPMAVVAWACCRAAGEADRAAERLWREELEKRSGGGVPDAEDRDPP